MEEALAIKGLGLLTLSISIVSIFIFVTLAYSGYQEVTYVMDNLSRRGFEENVVMNETHFSIQGLNLENRGVYPLTVALTGELVVNEIKMGSSSFGPLTIQPRSQGRIDFSLPVKPSEALRTPSVMRKALVNGTMTSFQFKVTGGLQPFLTVSVSGSQNNTVGAVLDGLNLRIGTPSPYNETHVKAPVTVSFTNKSPMPFDAPLSAKIVSTPTRPAAGNYGGGVITVSAQPEQRYESTSNIYIVQNAVERGAYVVELSLPIEGAEFSWRVTAEG